MKVDFIEYFTENLNGEVKTGQKTKRNSSEQKLRNVKRKLMTYFKDPVLNPKRFQIMRNALDNIE